MHSLAAVLLAYDATWNESDHPRGQPENAGQFGSGSGSAKSKAKAGKSVKPAPVPSAVPESLKPPANAHSVQKWMYEAAIDKRSSPQMRVWNVQRHTQTFSKGSELEKYGNALLDILRPQMAANPQTAPEFFHGTTDDVVASILQNGIQVQADHNYEADHFRGDRGQVVYITPDKNRADFYANSAKAVKNQARPHDLPFISPVVFRLNVPPDFMQHLSPDKLDTAGLTLPTSIPPEWIIGYKVMDVLTGIWTEHEVPKKQAADAVANEAFMTILVATPDSTPARKPKNIADILLAKDATWNESDHTRGQPDNAGQFGPGGASLGATPFTHVSQVPTLESFLEDDEAPLMVKAQKPVP